MLEGTLRVWPTGVWFTPAILHFRVWRITKEWSEHTLSSTLAIRVDTFCMITHLAAKRIEEPCKV